MLKESVESRQHETLLGEGNVVVAQKHEIYLLCKHSDEGISKVEICTALAEQFKLYDASIVSFRKAYNDT